MNAKRKPLRIAVLGAGAMGRMHAAAYAQMPDVALVDVPARDAERVWAAIEGAGIDAIDICLPSDVHARFAMPALRHGKHVFCETPMALDLDEARAMRDTARKASRLLQVGLLCRSIASYRHIKEIAEAGTHGRLLSLAAWRLGSYLHRDAPDHKPHYGDPTIELMTFDLDFANWLLGKPAHVSAAGAGEITALLDYGNGRSATIAASGLMPPGAPFTVGFRALFEGAVFELQQVFHEARRKSPSRSPKAGQRHGRSIWLAAIPTRSSCAASSIASPARSIRPCSTPIAPSRRWSSRSPFSAAFGRRDQPPSRFASASRS